MKDIFNKRSEAEMKLADKKRIEEIKKMKNTLEYKLGQDIKDAMRTKKTQKLAALRAVKNELIKVKTEKGSGGEITEEKEMEVLNRMVKQRKESADMFIEQGRQDLADVENEQSVYIKKYLPKQLTETEVEAIILKIVDDTGASGRSDMGKVMGAFNKDYAGQAPGKLVSTLANKALI